MSNTVLVITPHPDDAELYAGGTLLKMSKEGARVIIVIATDGGKGSYEYDADTLIHLRAEEALRAARVLGAEPPILLGHPDLNLDILPAGRLREQFVRLIRQYQPEVVITEDPFSPTEYHPDHRQVAWAASDAIHFAGLPLMYPDHLESGLQPHIVLEKYYYRETAIGANRIVDISDFMEKKVEALLQHQSQVSFLVEEVLRPARQAGIDVQSLMNLIGGDLAPAIKWFINAQAIEIGKDSGIPFGEAFRYERFPPIIETFLKVQAR